jgi:hypothetical protein
VNTATNAKLYINGALLSTSSSAPFASSTYASSLIVGTVSVSTDGTPYTGYMGNFAIAHIKAFDTAYSDADT